MVFFYVAFLNMQLSFFLTPVGGSSSLGWRGQGTCSIGVGHGGGDRGLIWRMGLGGGQGWGVEMKWFIWSQDSQQAGGFCKDFKSCLLFQLHI